MSFIQTFRNRKFDLRSCEVADLDIEDIAHALALVNRFGGHTREPLSVAQHSVMAAILASRYGVDPLSMLLHDAAEAYIGDMPKHIKLFLGAPYAEMEERVQRCISQKYGTTWPMTDAMKRLDMDLLETEFRDLKGKRAEGVPSYGTPLDIIVEPWTWQRSEDRFLSLFYEFGGRNG